MNIHFRKKLLQSHKENKSKELFFPNQIPKEIEFHMMTILHGWQNMVHSTLVKNSSLCVYLLFSTPLRKITTKIPSIYNKWFTLISINKKNCIYLWRWKVTKNNVIMYFLFRKRKTKLSGSCHTWHNNYSTQLPVSM